MIKPPTMGVFARDPPPPGRAGASSSSSSSSTSAVSPSSAQLQSVPSDLPTALQGASADPSRSSARLTTTATDDLPSDPTNLDDETAPDDDDQGTVDEEAGIIRCICGCDDDDGFTIQCDRCLVWQHCACFGMSQASVPDEYLCEQCEPRPVDVAFAQAHQQKRKNNEARKALMDRNLKRQAQALASNNFNQAYLTQEPVSSPTSSTLPLSSATSAPDPSLALPPNANLVTSSAARSRKPSQALDLSNTQFVVPDVPASAGAVPKGAKQRKAHKGSRRGYDTPSSVSTPVRGVFTPGSSHERIDDPFDLAEQLEAWHVEFTPILNNMVTDPSIVENLAAAMLDWEQGSPLKATQGPNGRLVVPTASSTGRHLSSTKHAMAESHPSSSSASSPSASSPRAPGSPSGYDNGPIAISAVGDECVPVELTGPSLADLASRTYVKHISESASAGVFSNVLYVNNSADEPQRGWCASRAFSRPVMHGLFADGSIPAGAFISELRGELYSASAYRNDPINQYAALGATKPHVHLLPPPLNLAIDARRYGNEARFVRFSCHPNAVLRPILFHPNGQPSVRSRTSSRAQSPAPALTPLISAARNQRYADTPPAESRSEEPQLFFGIFALTDIPRTHEITLGWEWDDAHIVHFLPDLVQNPYLESRDGQVDADKHTANMVALAEKGEFPYADTEFSVKMSTVSAALLGSVLCACIGSAAPPGGGGGASANNGRKQDCAVAQMLRVGNGMSLLNVTMPGKNNRRAKLPDFSPLVGIRRHWRPSSRPPTPDTSVKDDTTPTDAAALDVLAAQGEVEAMQSLGDVYEDGEIGCGSNEAAPKRNKSRRDITANNDRMDVDGDDQDTESAASDLDDADDTRSIASSLTDPLSGLSENETPSEDEDEDLMDALRAADGAQALARPSKGGEASAVDAQLSGLFLLPPKKRSMRTRIKATTAPSDEEDAEDNDATDKEEDDDPVKARKSRRSTDTSSRAKVGAKRKGKLDAGRASLDFSSDEGNGYDDCAATTPIKKRRKSGNIADPSSPLSSVPSPDSGDSSLSSPPPVPRLSAKHRLENERRTSDVELSKKKRAAQRARDGNGRASELRAKESASKRRKREEARIHRNAILDLGDTESSEDDLSEDEADETSKEHPDEDADVTMEDAGSGASTPRASKKAMPTLSSEVTASKKEEQDTSEADLPRKTKKDRPSTPTAVDDRKSAKKDTPTKAKKVRRILSDSEPSSDEEGAIPAALTSNIAKKEEAPQIQPEPIAPAQAESESIKAGPETKDSTTETTKSEDSKTPAVESTSSAAPPAASAPTPAPEVKKEEPRVKLSLAEYKRRLAERRVSEQQNASTSAPPLTPTLATPTSEVAPSPAVEKSDPVPPVSARASEPIVTWTPSEATGATPTGSTQASSSATDAAETGKSSAAVPRGVLFTSISAPTAIRSVEIPKSPSPEPAATLSAQQQSGLASGAVSKDSTSAEAVTSTTSQIMESPEAGAISIAPANASSPTGTATGAAATGASGASADTPALLMRLETRRARAPSVSHQPAGVDHNIGQQASTSNSSVSVSAAGDGFAKPLTTSTGTATTPTAITWGFATTSAAPPLASTPARSPSLGPTRVQGGRMPPSPSGSSSSVGSGFNPPKAPRAFMSPPGTTLPPPVSAVSASLNTAPVAASTTTPSSAITSTPARIGIAGVASGVGGIGNTPSSVSSTNSTTSSISRYPAPGLTSPTPTTAALPSYPPRNFAGIPKGPASMRDGDPRAEAWADAREGRESRGGEYATLRHGADSTLRDGGRDMGWGDRSRAVAGNGGGVGGDHDREPLRTSGGWGRRETLHHRDSHASRDGYRGAGEGRFFGGREEHQQQRDASVNQSGTGGSTVSSMAGETSGVPPHSASSSGVGNNNNTNSSGGGLASRLDVHPHSHSHAHAHPHSHSHSHSHSIGGGYAAVPPYRRPSATASGDEYDDSPATSIVSPYDRPSDPYNRGIIVRGRSLGLSSTTNSSGGQQQGLASAGGGNASGMVIRDARDGRDGRDGRGEYVSNRERDYDDGLNGSTGGRGGFRQGWGGRGRSRGSGGGLGGGGRGRGGGGGWGGR
ncbi:uncharacterized protein UTRI_04560 [Ustilago trichophora]|uniref:SET domain-containing protein n=1 Tax=Ustilago trichophora TaxID=86804 RepID=A0A5C3EDV4_9BASI|nr:uncharacterized protein UTRI_04560 [Ustilago trichophora]